MDVLTTFAATLEVGGESECRTQLLETLVSRRERFARKLRDAVAEREREMRRSLRACRKQIAKGFAASGERAEAGKAGPTNANPVALELAANIAASPRLNESNLHRYRRKIKDLRYLLALAGDEDVQLSESLREVKDAIGAWHDWAELEAIAAKVLDHGAKCPLQRQIQSTTKEHFEQALARANALQEMSFQRASAGKRKR